MQRRLTILLLSLTFSLPAWADDAPFRSITTPPPAEGPLTMDQIPPIKSVGSETQTPAKNNPKVEPPQPIGQTNTTLPAAPAAQ